MPVAPQITNLDQATVVALGPDYKNITEEIVGSASNVLMTAAANEQPNLVLDFADIEFFGSSFIEVLFRVWKRLQQRGGRFALANVSTYCHEVLKTTHLDSIWPVCATVDDAARVLKTPV
ncbi:STAS domain protein [Caulifigura coniformis]|uniref:STAS domain protein n=1 Tax=Caulifigura coniformis TaxID=2527983 RepID=A0A517SFT0_9PLAN|nr:STAS domain-containing protein [Caulifigura coniformis]QDT54986.1 STAS domain protein [Caulifigura coniformis]